MWLLDTTTLELQAFNRKPVPDYAILSHRWEDTEEMTFADVKAGVNLHFKGWQKIKSFCAMAKDSIYDLKYAWVDTCCIDKSSSAELSEAINSMYKWYQNAKICFVYLNDVRSCEDKSATKKQFRSSKWFTRAWTLQELIAPRDLFFFDCDWLQLGFRQEFYLEILQTTNFSISMDSTHIRQGKISVARRMSWAAGREAAREEDLAYSLLGLFQVNMPLLYGEGGEAAFRRLQLEIIQLSDDESIFAWEDPNSLCTGLLARSAASFKNSYDVEIIDDLRLPYRMTNKGLHMTAEIYKYWIDDSFGPAVYRMPLNCSNRQRGQVAIYLAQLDVGTRHIEACRVGPMQYLVDWFLESTCACAKTQLKDSLPDEPVPQLTELYVRAATPAQVDQRMSDMTTTSSAKRLRIRHGENCSWLPYVAQMSSKTLQGHILDLVGLPRPGTFM